MVRAERERGRLEGLSRGMPRKDARFARTSVEGEAERQMCWPTVTEGPATSRSGLWPGARWKGWRFVLVVKRGLNSGFRGLHFLICKIRIQIPA